MATYPPRGQNLWDDDLKAYIDAGDAANASSASEVANDLIAHETDTGNPHPQYLFRYAETLPSGTDLNTVTEPGIYTIAGAVNRPVAATATVRVVGYGTVARVQEFFEMTGSYRGRLWLRSTVDAGAEWSEWKPTDILTHEAAANPHSQYARPQEPNTFTRPQTFSSSAQQMVLERTTAPANTRRWWAYVETDGTLRFAPRRDDGSSDGFAFIVRRDGNIEVGGVYHITGTGNPNGVHSAPVGSIFRNTESGGWNGARVWRKDSGSGNTGWVVSEGDTGIRQVESLLEVPWTRQSTAWGLFLQRVGSRVSLSGYLNGDSGESVDVMNLPVGFRPPQMRFGSYHGIRSGSAKAVTVGVTVNPSGKVSVDYVADVADPQKRGFLDLTFETANDWPSALPGTPA